MQTLSIQNINAVPRLEKIVLNMGVGAATKDRKEIQEAMEDLTRIAGQTAVITHARKSIAGFGIAKGAPIGVKVTLRGRRMYEFLDKLIHIVLPRTRDFRGLPVKGFDRRGNYSLGLVEQGVFPEIDVNKVQKRRGLQVVFTTTADNDRDGEALLRSLGLPLQEAS
jgi:large subunit ribosomal protein L5